MLRLSRYRQGVAELIHAEKHGRPTMKKYLFILILITIFATPLFAETTITYQGQLQDGGGVVTATPDMEFRLYDSLTGDTQVGPTLERDEVPVTDGLFQVELDFGNVYDQELWLEVTVDGTALEPLQRIAPAPMALHALNAPDDTLAGLNCDDSEGVSWNGTDWVCTELGEGSGSAWELDGGNVFYTDGFVGIGTASPSTALQVDGSVIAGSDENTAVGENSFASGGSGSPWVNTASGDYSFVAGGRRNEASGSSAFVAGATNDATEPFSFVGGGFENLASGNSSVVMGGSINEASGHGSVVLGGGENLASGTSSLAAGQGARAEHARTFVWSGSSLTSQFASTDTEQFLIDADGGVGIGTNTPQESLDVDGRVRVGEFAGASSEWVCRTPEGTLAECSGDPGNGDGAWALGGNAGTDPDTHFLGTTDATPLEMRVDGQRVLHVENYDHPDAGPGWIGGHAANEIQNDVFGATIGGGGNSDFPNIVGSVWGTVGGGAGNSANAGYATIGGGLQNGTSMAASGATIGGGRENTVSHHYSTIAGGMENTASGFQSSVPGGGGNEAAGDFSLAAGRNAIAGADGSFVWGDSVDHETPSVGENGFLARATGGVSFVTGVDGSGNPTAGAVLSDGGSNWQSISDRHAKQAIEGANPGDVLSRVLKMPISEYSYKSQEKSIRHMGPMAQDFHPLFGLGEDELRISAMNLAGVALAAIQGLHAELEDRDIQLEKQEQRIVRLESENAELRQIVERNTELEDRLAKLEALLHENRQVAGGQQ
jgi:hypothetical protein